MPFAKIIAEHPEVNRSLAEELSGLAVAYPADDGCHPLAGRRVPDLRLAEGSGFERLFELLRGGHFALLTRDDIHARHSIEHAALMRASVLDGSLKRMARRRNCARAPGRVFRVAGLSRIDGGGLRSLDCRCPHYGSGFPRRGLNRLGGFLGSGRCACPVTIRRLVCRARFAHSIRPAGSSDWLYEDHLYTRGSGHRTSTFLSSWRRSSHGARTIPQLSDGRRDQPHETHESSDPKATSALPAVRLSHLNCGSVLVDADEAGGRCRNPRPGVSLLSADALPASRRPSR